MTTTDRELINSLVASLPRLRRAVTVKPVEASAVGFVSGGAPSFELVSLTALALLQDMRRDAPLHEYAIRSSEQINCRAFVPAVDLVAMLRHLGQALDACAEQRQSVPAATEARSAVGTWVRRSALVLREARAPYRLLGPDGSRVRCPVVEQGEEGAYVCAGDLLVFRDDETGVPRSIRCAHDVTHDWDSGPGWMRLGALLGVLA
jgi:hypothetical protein